MNKTTNKQFQQSNSDTFVITELKKELGPMGPVMVPFQNVSIGYLKIEDIFIKLCAREQNKTDATMNEIWKYAENICDFINTKRNELIEKNNSNDSNAFTLKH